MGYLILGGALGLFFGFWLCVWGVAYGHVTVRRTAKRLRVRELKRVQVTPEMQDFDARLRAKQDAENLIVLGRDKKGRFVRR